MEDLVNYITLNMDLSDMFYQVNSMLQCEEYLRADNKRKKDIILDRIKLYLLNKLNESNIREFDVSSSLVDIVEYICIHQEDKDKINNLIHYLMSQISLLQGFEAYWLLNDKYGEEERMIHINYGILDKFETGYKCDMFKSFMILYSFFTETLKMEDNNKCLELKEK